jgi:hypothetical protein
MIRGTAATVGHCQHAFAFSSLSLNEDKVESKTKTIPALVPLAGASIAVYKLPLVPIVLETGYTPEPV